MPRLLSNRITPPPKPAASGQKRRNGWSNAAETNEGEAEGAGGEINGCRVQRMRRFSLAQLVCTAQTQYLGGTVASLPGYGSRQHGRSAISRCAAT